MNQGPTYANRNGLIIIWDEVSKVRVRWMRGDEWNGLAWHIFRDWFHTQRRRHIRLLDSCSLMMLQTHSWRTTAAACAQQQQLVTWPCRRTLAWLHAYAIDADAAPILWRRLFSSSLAFPSHNHTWHWYCTASFVLLLGKRGPISLCSDGDSLTDTFSVLKYNNFHPKI